MDFTFLTQAPKGQSFILRIDHETLNTLVGAITRTHNAMLDTRQDAVEEEDVKRLDEDIRELEYLCHEINRQIDGRGPGEYKLRKW
jgi:hypothetical protein